MIAENKNKIIKNITLNKKTIILSLLFLIFTFLLFSIGNAYAADPLVHCGRGSDINNRCTLCDLIVGIRNIVNWGRTILIIVALTAIVIGGFMYIISMGDKGKMESAKNIIKQALWGVVIVLGAWLIVNTVLWLLAKKNDLGVGVSDWSTFQCTSGGTNSEGGDEISPDTEVADPNNNNEDGLTDPTEECPYGYKDDMSGCLDAPRDTGTPSGSNNPVSTLGEEGVRSDLASSGITINKDACKAGQYSGCTDVGGLRENSISGVKNLKNSCGSGCDVMITGGSEKSSIHNNGTYSHANGYKVDVRPNSQIDSYITTNYQRIPGTRSTDGAIGYKDSSGNTYYREGNHWDITYY